MKFLRSIAIAIALLGGSVAFATTVPVTGNHVLDRYHNDLVSGNYCLGSSCFAVTNGKIADASTVATGTYTVTIVDSSSATIFSLPGVVISGAYVSDSLVVGLGQTLTTLTAPVIACAIGANALETDVSPSRSWMCAVSQGKIQWVAAGGGGGGSTLPSGYYSANGAPAFSCTSPCLYGRVDTGQFYTLNAVSGVVSSTWVIVAGAPGTNGTDGAPGPPVNFIGAYDSGHTYAVGDAVSYSGASYISMSAGNIGHTPSSGSPWGLLAAQGAAGTTFVTNLDPASTSDYPQLNPQNLFNCTDRIMAGASLMSVAGVEFGVDLGCFGGHDATRMYASGGFPNTSFGGTLLFGFTPTQTAPTAQSQFDDAMAITPTQLLLGMDLTAPAFYVDRATGDTHLHDLYIGGTIHGVPYISVPATSTVTNFAGMMNFGVNSVPSPTGLLAPNGFRYFCATNVCTGMYWGNMPDSNGSGGVSYVNLQFHSDGGCNAWASNTSGAIPATQSDFHMDMTLCRHNLWQLFPDANNVNGQVEYNEVTGIYHIRSQSGLAGSGALIVDGPTTLTGPVTALSVGLPDDYSQPLADAINGSSATSLAQTLTAIAVAKPSPFQYTRTGMVQESAGDSITAGCCVVDLANSYVNRLSVALGASSVNNIGVASDMACDASNRVIQQTSADNSNSYFTLMISTNDSTLHPAPNAASEALFNVCHQASVYWLGTRSADRTQMGTLTATNWSAQSEGNVSGLKTTTNGASVTHTVTTYGGPLLSWSRATNGNGGTHTITVDSGTPVAVSDSPVTTIATYNGSTSTPILTKIYVAAGSHTVTYTATSATGSGNVVEIIADGTVAKHGYYHAPSVGVGLTPPWQDDFTRDSAAQYSLDILSNVRMAQVDGLDARVCDVRTGLKNGTDASLYSGGTAGGAHPGLTGHAVMAQAFADCLLAPPGPYVTRDVPASSSSRGTPGDTWVASDGYLYVVKAASTIWRVLASNWP